MKGGGVMFKKILFISAALFFAVGVLGTSIWRTSVEAVNQSANEEESLQDDELILGTDQEATEPGEATETAEKSVDYDLTWGGKIYPGILPDHLLYPLKMIRDRIRLFLTTDLLKKAELLLVYADKRLMTAKALIENNKVDLGIKTLTKAEKYLEKAVNQEGVAKQAGKDTSVFLERLSRATLKHEEIVLEFGEGISDTNRSAYENALQYARQGYQKVMESMEE